LFQLTDTPATVIGENIFPFHEKFAFVEITILQMVFFDLISPFGRILAPFSNPFAFICGLRVPNLKDLLVVYVENFKDSKGGVWHYAKFFEGFNHFRPDNFFI